MWQDLGYDEASCEDLLTELRIYRRNEKPYNKHSRKEESHNTTLVNKIFSVG